MAVVYPDTDEYVAHMPDVVAAVRDLGDDIRTKADAELAAARAKSKDKKRFERVTIETEREDTDTLVALEHPDARAPMSIEFGHKLPNGDTVPGLHIMGKAAGLK